jgi:hypothetical protein
MKNVDFDITMSIMFTNVCNSKQKPFLDKHWKSQSRH